MNIIETNEIEENRELWVMLNNHHEEMSIHLKRGFDNKTFESRFEGYSKDGIYTIFYA